MKQPRVIQRFSSLLLASLLLFTSVWGYGSLVQHRTLPAKKAVHEQAKAGKTTDSQEDDAQLNAAQFEAVAAPAVTIDEGFQTVFLLPVPAFLIFLLLSVPLLRHFTLPHYYFSYFQHMFGHHIATNAP